MAGIRNPGAARAVNEKKRPEAAGKAKGKKCLEIAGNVDEKKCPEVTGIAEEKRCPETTWGTKGKKRLRALKNGAAFFLLFLLLFGTMRTWSAAETRRIYIGDIIKLRIQAADYTADEIREKFSDFEIVELKEKDKGFEVSLRTFEPGERKVLLGDTEIIIDVGSVLSDIQQDGVFEGSREPVRTGVYIVWRHVFYAVAAVCAVSGVLYVRSRTGDMKDAVPANPYDRFLRQSRSIMPEDDEFYIKQTRCLKEYLEAVFACRILSRTTAEILAAAEELPGLDEGVRAELGRWLEESDMIKFAGVSASRQRNEEMKKRLEELVSRIEAIKGQSSIEGAA